MKISVVIADGMKQVMMTPENDHEKEASDTTKAYRHLPLYHYGSWDEFEKNLPKDCQVVCVEQVEGATELSQSCHPERAIYVLGAEDYGIPKELMVGKQKMPTNTWKRILKSLILFGLPPLVLATQE